MRSFCGYGTINQVFCVSLHPLEKNLPTIKTNQPMDYTRYFNKGGWAALGGYYATHPKKLKKLLKNVRQYASREGLAQARDELVLICQYVRDVFTGRYKDYNVLHLSVIIGALVYVVTPVDAMPDFLPVGLIDDTAILLWATHEFASELERYREHLLHRDTQASAKKPDDIEDIEFEEIPPFQLPA